MKSQSTNPDSGYEDHRIEFVREDEPGVVPDNPDWELFSDTLETALEVDSDASIEARRGLGEHEAQRHFSGPEEHTATIAYDLQRFFVDDDGDPLDPAGDVLLRGDDVTSHTVVDRADKGDARTYTVARGAFPSLDSIDADPGEPTPVVVTLEYEARKVRSYRVEQPDGETLTVHSTDASDDSQTLTIEGDFAQSSSELELNGTSDVSTETDFHSIDALWLDAETQGDVVIEDSEGNELARLYGANSYDAGGGDRGIPPTGDGSHADDIDSEYERFLEDEIEADDEPLAAEIRSASLAYEIDYDREPILGDTVHAIHPGDSTITLDATTAGTFEHNKALTRHVRGVTLDVTWTMSSGTITLNDAVLSEPGTVGPSADDVVSSIDNTFEARSIDVSAD